MSRVSHGSSRPFLPLEPESRLLGRPAHNEREAQRLAAMRRVKSVQLDVVLRECLPASA